MSVGMAPLTAAVSRVIIGPEMPSAEEVEIEEGDELFIGSPPPALVAEAEPANEAEVTRIMGAESDYTGNCLFRCIQTKCPHPQAHQAFVILNKALKVLQGLDKQEEFKAELQAMREAAQWSRLQGISMEGDDELLVHEVEVKVPPKRDEWMTTLPPESVTKQSARSNKNAKEGRGDTSVWTDTPLELAQKANTHYLEAYNEAAALASNEEENTKSIGGCKATKEEIVARERRDRTVGRQTVNLDTANMAKGLISRFTWKFVRILQVTQ
ncbi:hypothetical protein ES332_D04G230700v1 [Gossypium tomentosum]|uniref:DUF3752 domain-containing protein n=1 Tax=Gossypium tomentosum TaxID=34277 RepID=A0A5D2LGG1_GOSTO|nr:hypothetical protein ES332_D04G230700v1 [Gossypium tomentosum]